MGATPLESTKLLNELMEKPGIAEAKEISEDTPLQYITKDQTHLCTLLLFGGYLTKEREIDEDTFDLKIPNKEIKKRYNKFVKRVTETYMGDVSEIHRAIYENNYDNFEETFNKKLEEVLSIQDRGKDKEYSYHMIVLGMLMSLARYEVMSNKEMRNGRCDIWMKNKVTKQEYIYEFKRAKKEEEMEKLCEEAMKQIEDKYSKGQETKIGIAFFAKSAKIMVKEGDKVLLWKPNTKKLNKNT